MYNKSILIVIIYYILATSSSVASNLVIACIAKSQSECQMLCEQFKGKCNIIWFYEYLDPMARGHAQLFFINQFCQRLSGSSHILIVSPDMLSNCLAKIDSLISVLIKNKKIPINLTCLWSDDFHNDNYKNIYLFGCDKFVGVKSIEHLNELIYGTVYNTHALLEFLNGNGLTSLLALEEALRQYVFYAGECKTAKLWL